MQKVEKKDTNKIYQGNIKITSENVADWEKKLKGIEQITGYLSIYSNASLPALKSVGGYLSIYSNASLKADALKSVGGDLSINSNASLPALKSVGGYLYVNSNASLPALKSVGGDLSINSNASLPALKSVGGDLSINSKINEKLEKQLWENNTKNKWRLSDMCSDWLLSQTGKIDYYINRVQFDKKLFDAVRHGELSAQQVFAISNMEHRRIAYEKMDKAKMAELPGLQVLDESKDKYGLNQRIISFTLEGFNKPFLFYHCICPSTGREYYLETKQKTCAVAKAMSFGLPQIEFTEEW